MFLVFVIFLLISIAQYSESAISIRAQNLNRNWNRNRVILPLFWNRNWNFLRIYFKIRNRDLTSTAKKLNLLQKNYFTLTQRVFGFRKYVYTLLKSHFRNSLSIGKFSWGYLGSVELITRRERQYAPHYTDAHQYRCCEHNLCFQSPRILSRRDCSYTWGLSSKNTNCHWERN